jgi:hypothetical protein
MSGQSVSYSRWEEFRKKWLAADGWEACGFSEDEAMEWTEFGVEPGDAKRYKKNGILKPPDANYSWNSIEIEEAIQWVKEGFECFDDAAEWIEWKVSPKNAKKYKEAGKESPDDEFRDVGLSFTVAMKWLEQGFHSYEYSDPHDEDENYWKNWHDAGLKPNQAAVLRTELFKYIEKQFDEGVRARRKPFLHTIAKKGKEFELSLLASECSSTLTQLAAAGMKIDAENLFKWRGFSAEMITATVDNGLEPDDAGEALKLKIHPNQLELFERIKAVEDIFMDSNYAKFLLNAGITEKQFQYLLKKGFRLTRIADAIKIHSLTINTIVKWAKAGWQVDVLEKDKNGHQQSVLGPWIETKLDPETAYRWKKNDFSADDCEKWIKAGITDPEIANRRKVAGIEPKS